MADDGDTTALQSVPSHLKMTSPPLDESSCEPDSDTYDQSADKKDDTGSGNNLSDDPRPKGLGDAWIDIPMSQAIEFIPVLTPGDIKDIARYKGKVVVARINEQISTHKEKMSQSIATKKEKMSQSLTQQRDKMTQQREKMSQSLTQQRDKMTQQREKMSHSLTQQRDKMTQQREKMSQSLTQQRDKMTQQREKMSQSLTQQRDKMTQQREKMSHSLTQQRDKMTQQREKMSQSLSFHKVKVSQSLTNRREKMSQQRERVSQSLTNRREKMSQQRERVSQSLTNRREKMSQQRERVSQSLTQQRERMSQHREKMSQTFSIRRERVSLSFSNKRDKMSQHRERVSIRLFQRRLKMSQSLTSHRERMSQSLSIKRNKMTLKSRQVREHMSVGAARVHHMREQVVTQVKTKLGTGMQPIEFDIDASVSPLRDSNTSPEKTPESRRRCKMSQSCPNLYPGQLGEEGIDPCLLTRKDNLSICSFATTVSAQSSQSELSDTQSYDTECCYSDEEHSFLPAPPVPDIIIQEIATAPIPIRQVEAVISHTNSCASSQEEEACPPLPLWAFPKHSHQLVTFPQLPAWYKDNDCIRSYYRPPLSSLRKCVKSIGYWHTESGNIWSHLVGLIIFLLFVPHFAYTMFVRGTTDSDFQWMDPVVISIFICSALTCLFLSTSFHTLMCHSNKVYMLCLRVDYCGIACLIIGSYVPWFYYLFYCLRIVQITYISILTTLGVTAIVTMIAPFFNRPKFRIFRALLFGCVGSFGVIPAFHAFGVQGFSSAMSLGGTALMFCGGMFYIVGAGIYAIRLPERIFPGKCDLLLQSHTIFHICVLIAATFHYFSLLRIQEIRLLRGGYCSPDINI